MNPNKVQDCYEYRMPKLCAVSISKPLHILFNNSVMNKCFPSAFGKANIIAIYKKGDKQKVTDLCPSSILVANFLQNLL